MPIDPDRARTQEHTGPLPSGPEFPWTDAFPTQRTGGAASPVHPLGKGAVAALDDRRLIADLAALVAIPSVGGTPEEVRAQRWGAEALRRLGADVQEWDDRIADLSGEPDWPGQELSLIHISEPTRPY